MKNYLRSLDPGSSKGDQQAAAGSAPRPLGAVRTTPIHAEASGRSILDSWGRVMYRRRRLVLLAAVLFVLLAGVWGTSIFAKVQTAGGFNAPGSQSQQEASLATSAFGRNAADVVVLVPQHEPDRRDPAFRSAVTAATGGPAAQPGRVRTPPTGPPARRQFVSASGHADLRGPRAGRRRRRRPADQLRRHQDRAGRDRRPAGSQVGGVVPTNG